MNSGALRRVGMGMAIKGKLDTRFSEASEAVGWQQVSDALAAAELYWLTTVRADAARTSPRWSGRGWTTRSCSAPAPRSRRRRTSTHSTAVAVTTGVNTWNDGLDVVVEGDAERVTGIDTLTRLADAIREKYNGEWDFTPDRRRLRPHRR